MNNRQKKIIDILTVTGEADISLFELELSKVFEKTSRQTINRDIQELIDKRLILRLGKGPSTKYTLSKEFRVIASINLDTYFSKNIDEREIKKDFQFKLLSELESINLFEDDEYSLLDSLNDSYQSNLRLLSPTIYAKELERITIELSWKSSVIEGNTYSLIETETLLREGIEAEGKKKEEAIMLLNHKNALNYIYDNKEEFEVLTISKIENLHSILIDDLGVSKNIRKTLVGITGTNYSPLDNEYQIREALEQMCLLVNKKDNVFEKALLVLALIAYIQPFEDGNKRTSRILANAVLLSHQKFPLALRSVNENEYKLAKLIFYEQGNISKLKEIFIEQARFTTENYFRAKKD